ncbi:O-antigen ligase family protein [Myxococcus sp. Y35]|uniref:O-antigen ligase family protein n=1 Tax=Pseudomyxococcus flavus TaxID=3115648 RepID=UPI003CEEBF4E
MRGPPPPRAERPQLQGPGVLRRRYVRRAPGSPLEVGPAGVAVPARGMGAGSNLLASGRLVPLFVGLLLLLQLALLVEAIAPLRVVVRVLAFGISLLLLVLVRGRSLKHPALPFVLGALGVTALQFFNPGTGTPLASVAQLGIQLAIAAPLLWVTRLSIDPRTFHRTLALLFLFNAASAGVGVLQVYFPGRFEPALSSAVASHGQGYVSSLQFETTDGVRVFRPMGLTDTPGGAATGGFYAVLLGAGFLLSSRRRLFRVLSMGGILVGLFSLYLSQVRATAVMLAVCLVALAGVLVLSGRLGRLVAMLAVVGTAGVATFGWAVAVGGDAVLARWSALFAASPEEVYHRNRGYFLTGTFDRVLPEYPLGAGLGRYGMVNAYFGDPRDVERPSLWAEIQWTAWVYDGGILVLFLYPMGILASLWWAFQVARIRAGPEDEFWLWGGVLFAYNLGALAFTFSYPFFMSQTGMEFWLLNAALFSALSHAKTLHAHRR